MGQMNTKETVSVQEFAKALGLEVVYAGRGHMVLDNISVSRPGLQLSGFFQFFDCSRVQVIGNAEYGYLKTVSTETRKNHLKQLFESGIPCLILARDLEVTEEVLAAAEGANCPLLRSQKVTTFLVNDIAVYLNRLLAPQTTMHGVLLDVYGVGVLLTGNSGIGKSETALELVKRGHRLVADDSVIIKQISEELIGTSPDMIRYYMEIRGIGIVNISHMFGAGSILKEKEIDLVVQLEKWQDGKEYDRLGEKAEYETILGVKKSRIVIPVKPGRNLATIIEVAARNYRLKTMGYDAAAELIEKTMGG